MNEVYSIANECVPGQPMNIKINMLAAAVKQRRSLCRKH